MLPPESFESALESGDIHGIRACPKADLHTHGFAKADRDYVRERTGRDIEPASVPLGSMDEMHDWVKIHIGDLFAGSVGRTLGIEANFVGALKDGVTRIEFGDDVWMVTQGLGPVRNWVDSSFECRRAWRPRLNGSPSLDCRGTVNP